MVKKPVITHQQLEMLLENWGLFCTTGNWGPAASIVCGSAEREYADNLGRYVWDDGSRPARAMRGDDALGMLIERALESCPMDWRRVLLRWYGLGHRNLCARNQALLVSARVYVLEQLERGNHYA